MNHEALHTLLVEGLGLLPEPVHNPVSRTYFYGRVEWHPSRSTRLVRVLFDPHGHVSNVQLYVSSDNNNTVLLAVPCSEGALRAAVAQEIDKLKVRIEIR
jgi:hypothetical protein